MKKQRKKKPMAGEPQTVTRAVTCIRLSETNSGKLAALDVLAPCYLALCQQYVTLFCTEELPDKFRGFLYETPLSARWHRVAIMQAAGIAKSWRSNKSRAEQEYQEAQAKYGEEFAEYEAQQERGMLKEGDEALKEPKTPVWREWNIPTLQQWCIQATAYVARFEASEDSSFDYARP